MIIYPSIDILDGKCVRLSQGKYDQVTTYPKNPVDYAKQWNEKGAKFLHVVDLDGARSGKPVNDLVIREIAQVSQIPVQVGGGIRTLERINELLDLGINRVILGTAAVRNPELLQEAVEKFGSSIVVGIDAMDGYAAVEGWEEKSKIKAIDLAKKMENMGVKTIIYTDISRDGMLTGPNVKAMKEMADSVSCEIIASGGVGNIDHISALYGTGVAGVIVGKSLYEGKVDFDQVVKTFKQEEK